jgi:hypothetical protein
VAPCCSAPGSHGRARASDSAGGYLVRSARPSVPWHTDRADRRLARRERAAAHRCPLSRAIENGTKSRDPHSAQRQRFHRSETSVCGPCSCIISPIGQERLWPQPLHLTRSRRAGRDPNARYYLAPSRAHSDLLHIVRSEIGRVSHVSGAPSLASGCARPLAKDLDHLRAEGRQIVGLAARNQRPVHDDFPVHTQVAPALRRSVCSKGQEVTVRPRTASASTSAQGP